jgi:hypothetical protein
MFQDRKLEAHVSYEALNKTDKIFLTSTNKLDELKTQLNQYFVHVDENQTTCHVVVYVCIVMKDDCYKETNVYHHEMLKDDDDVMSIFLDG